eukprot:2895647-Rhodomonas_salina.1
MSSFAHDLPTSSLVRRRPHTISWGLMHATGLYWLHFPSRFQALSGTRKKEKNGLHPPMGWEWRVGACQSIGPVYGSKAGFTK